MGNPTTPGSHQILNMTKIQKIYIETSFSLPYLKTQYKRKKKENKINKKNEDKELNYLKIWVYGHWNLLILIHIK